MGLYYRTLGKEIEIGESGETRKKKSPRLCEKKKSSMSIDVCGLACLESGAYL